MSDRLAQIGPRLRSARQARGWTLQGLAERAGMSVSTLSMLESGKRQASPELLLPLTDRLGITIDDLLPREATDPRVRGAVEHHDGVTSIPSMREHAPVQSYKITMPPRVDAPASRTHDGVECFYVLDGLVRLVLGNSEHVLQRGEAAEFDTLVPYSISATGERAAVTISVFSAAGESAHTRIGGRVGRPCATGNADPERMPPPHVDTPAPRRLRLRAVTVVLAVVVPAILLTALGAWHLWPTGDRPTITTTGPGQTFGTADVSRIDLDEADPQRQVRITTDGVEEWLYVPPEYLPELSVGDRLQVVHLSDMPEGSPSYIFVDFERGPPLTLLAVVFVVLVVLVARWRGAAALIGLGTSLTVIGVFTLPALTQGHSAVGVALVSASTIMFVVLYLAHGVTLKTSTALLGTLVGLLATAGIAAWASGAAQLTGLSDEYGLDLVSFAPEVRLREVLLCGMVLAGLGVLNDVTITQASAVWELRAGAPAASRREVFSSAMRIGRDHIASTVYTIVFAYLGASLPLVILVSMSDRSILGALGSGELAEEVARTLVGSIGLVLAIPLTTAIGVLMVGSSHVAVPEADAPTLPTAALHRAAAGNVGGDSPARGSR